MNTYVVTKRLSTDAGVLEPGTEVDVSTWRNARLLEQQRYIKPAQPDGREKIPTQTVQSTDRSATSRKVR
jgi:hypothetical protein